MQTELPTQAAVEFRRLVRFWIPAILMTLGVMFFVALTQGSVYLMLWALFAFMGLIVIIGMFVDVAVKWLTDNTTNPVVRLAVIALPTILLFGTMLIRIGK